ncbi:hypothetical protein C8Q78DRAFT_1072066 [Trametes maxima]|nr:hypothetical protein C8Q78DRAFT_1072066 [Trametes maxima]
MVAYRTHDGGGFASPASASLAVVASLPSSPPFAHSRLTAFPILDMEQDRLARACGQGPVLDIPPERPSHRRNLDVGEGPSRAPALAPSPSPTANDDDRILSLPSSLSWALRTRATSVRVPQRQTPPHHHQPSRPRSASQPASIPVFSPSSPRRVLRALVQALDPEGVQLEDCLDVRDVFERWDAQGDRGLARREAARHHNTFGAPVWAAVRCASMSTVIGGYQHEVPWVVYACIEELNRTGIYQPGLFRAVPNRTRLARLVEAFDVCSSACASPSSIDEICPRMAPTLSTTRASLRKESMPDICALLKNYLDLLPEPLLGANITLALHRLCVQPCLARQNELDGNDSDSDGGYFASHGRARSAPPSTRFPPSNSLHGLLDDTVPMTPSEHRTAELTAEAPHVLLAQHLLRLATTPALALLAYLLGFFTQLPLCPDNGIDFTDVARMFGRVLVGGPGVEPHVVRESVHWLLERWARVSEGLFELAGGSGSSSDDGHADSAPVSACRATFASPVFSPLLDSAETTPRQAQGAGGEVGMMRIQMPYDPGLCSERTARSHSTSVSSNTSSATTASVEMDELPEPDVSYVVASAKDVLLDEPRLPEVGEYDAPMDPFDPSMRISSHFELFDREYVSCPPSPRRYFARVGYDDDADVDSLSSPPASVRSLDVESSWADYSGSTSRCSLSLSSFESSSSPPAYEKTHEKYFGRLCGPNDSTPRNSASFD